MTQEYRQDHGQDHGREYGIALIGSGFMGKAHALAYRAAAALVSGTPRARLEVLCDTPAARAHEMAAQFGFARASDDWRAAIDDPRVDIVSITTPNKLHMEMAVAAAEAGKHVWCEKPLALTLDDAAEMVAAVKTAGVRSMIGYNYLRNPAILHARSLIDAGEIGRIVQFRGNVDEDYQADPSTPWTWRCLTAEAGLGVLGDLTCHLVSLAVALVGPIESVLADMETVYATRPKPDGDGVGDVENEDVANALVRFENGVGGVLMSSRAAWGRKNTLGFEIHGERGMIRFDQERMNELEIYRNDGPRATQGFSKILTGPAHPPYGEFVPAPGHQLGFIDLKTLEAADFLNELNGAPRVGPDIAEAYEIEKVIHAIARSAQEARRVRVASVG